MRSIPYSVYAQFFSGSSYLWKCAYAKEIKLFNMVLCNITHTIK